MPPEPAPTAERRPFHHRLAAAGLGMLLILLQGGWERSDAVVLVLADRFGAYADCMSYAERPADAGPVARAYAALARPGLLGAEDFRLAAAACRARREATLRAIFY